MAQAPQFNRGQLIIELVDVYEVADTDALKHCFSDLAEDNQALKSEFLAEQQLIVHPKIN